MANLQRLLAALTATGCPIAHVRLLRPGEAEYQVGAGATPEQVAAAAEVYRTYQWSADLDFERDQVRTKAAQAYDAGIGYPLEATQLALRSFIVMVVEDRYNTVQQFNALLTQIAAATSLADLKTRVAANVQPLPTYGANLANSINAIKNALKQRIGRGEVD